MEMRKGGSLLNLFCDLFFSPSRKHGFLAALTNKRSSEMYGTKSRGLRTWKLTGPSSGAENSHLHGIHAFQCPDKVGIMARITECFASRGANILSGDVYVSLHGRQGRNPVFYSRSEFIYDPMQWPRALIDGDFLRLSEIFNAQISAVRIPDLDPPLKVALLVSWQDHCLVDLLYRWQERELPVYITCVISNHMREPNTHVIRFLERHGIPYHFIPANKENKREEEILNLISDTDFLVLARYMQVLSPAFLKIYGKDIINIHHGLLPSFKGANPYKQAYEAGVKLIGATSHFVTEELDDGPIIEQMVDRVSHRDTLKAFAMKSENLERQCLAKAVKSYCELRIMRYSGNKTIIFD